MKVLLVGGGGREHAIAWKLRQSPRLGKLYVAPGNAGTAQIAENVPVKATDVEGLLAFALKEGIEFTIVGQDDPLALGIVDAFQAKGLKIFGPTQAAAQIEASKVFSKRLMKESGVPTTLFNVYTDHASALEEVRRHFAAYSGLPTVIKASGLALGKGAYVCHTLAEAEQALDEIMVKKLHGGAGDQVVIEEYAGGQEVSIHAFCDGKSFELFPSAQDHKPALDGDKGPNTGGMGTIAPVPWFNASDAVSEQIVGPILAGLQEKGSPFIGLLYPGLKMPETGPMVLEFNARFGDPETQVYMRLLKTDLLDIFEACVEGRLHEINVEWNPGFAACIVMASGGYPSPDYKKGFPITGIDNAEILPGIIVFHAGTKQADGKLVTSGGRVLGVTGVGATLQEALDHAYHGVECIRFEGMQYRKDIGAKSLV
ncbi:MAG: phosphoribosylamine--glycine ligase [Patescibacteria group bacterium]|nr:phosphoribosylamine--glycine ligase [Patescibacteria group bacterium]MDE2438713.1 phosphoribosylamine--glycine ligase [Patescibacteria group bacterium]